MLCILLTLLVITVGLPGKTYAVDPCFSNLPDTAWQNGEPLEVKNQLGYDLTGTFKEQRFYNDLFRNWLESDSGQLTKIKEYVYQGKNCVKRTILIKNITVVPSPNIVSQDQGLEIIKRLQKNFLEEEKAVQEYSQIINILKSKPSYYRGAVLKEGRYISGQLFRLDRSFFGSSASERLGALVAQLRGPECSFVIPFPGLSSKYLFPTYGKLQSINYNQAKSCVLNWYLIPDSLTSDYLIPLGESIVTREQTPPQQTTIKCTKGTTTKIVSGNPPKCPKGYK